MIRTLGRSGIEVSAAGMGCLATGGVWTFEGNAAGWSAVDDREATFAIEEAVGIGVTFFDTTANYGCGHGERILGSALTGHRDRVVLATKTGHRIDAKAKNVTYYGASEEASNVVHHMREDLENSSPNWSPTASTSTRCNPADRHRPIADRTR